jgi:hypothetical protein
MTASFGCGEARAVADKDALECEGRVVAADAAKAEEERRATEIGAKGAGLAAMDEDLERDAADAARARDVGEVDVVELGLCGDGGVDGLREGGGLVVLEAVEVDVVVVCGVAPSGRWRRILYEKGMAPSPSLCQVWQEKKQGGQTEG